MLSVYAAAIMIGAILLLIPLAIGYWQGIKISREILGREGVKNASLGLFIESATAGVVLFIAAFLIGRGDVIHTALYNIGTVAFAGLAGVYFSIYHYSKE